MLVFTKSENTHFSLLRMFFFFVVTSFHLNFVNKLNIYVHVVN